MKEKEITDLNRLLSNSSKTFNERLSHREKEHNNIVDN